VSPRRTPGHDPVGTVRPRRWRSAGDGRCREEVFLNTKHPRWLGLYATARVLLITAGCCCLVYWIVAGLALFPYWLESAGPDSGSLRAVHALRAVHFMTDYYQVVLLITLLGASLYLWRGGTRRRACTLLIGVSAVWWLAMLGLRVISLAG
jgi:hypothetical protein